MKICDVLNKERIFAKVDINTKENCINSLIDLFKGDSRVNDIETMRTAVHERESIMSTGIGNGFAIPHAKTAGVNEMIAGFATLKSPIEFEALDAKPVELVFLLVGEENAVGPHIKMLSRISRLMNKEAFRDRLVEAKSVDEIFNLFEEEEKNLLDIS
jgi:fructose-specific phosphotransferase system IIA component